METISRLLVLLAAALLMVEATYSSSSKVKYKWFLLAANGVSPKRTKKPVLFLDDEKIMQQNAERCNNVLKTDRAAAVVQSRDIRPILKT